LEECSKYGIFFFFDFPYNRAQFCSLPVFLFAVFKGYTPPELITGITGISDFKQLYVCGHFQHHRLLYDFQKFYEKE